MNTNPFPATFLNLKGCLQVMEVTRDQATFMIWTADFDTDLEVKHKHQPETAGMYSPHAPKHKPKTHSERRKHDVCSPGIVCRA